MRPDPPVVLLAGPGSRRLEAAALDRARAILCRKGALCDDDCTDCRRTRKKEHPDLLVAAPERRRRVNPPAFDEASESKETTIPTALVRAVAADAFRNPYEAPRRAIVLLDVERTEPAAFSALLKILEEPPEKTSFLLTSTRPRLLPPTILSRVALQALPGTSRTETAAALQARGLQAEEAEARAAFIPNDADDAAALDLAGARDLRDAILEALSGVLLSNSVSWAIVLGTLLAAEDAAGTIERLGLTARLLRDAVAARVDPAGRAVVHRERFRDLVLLQGAGNARLLDAATRALELAATLGESRRNARLAVEALSLKLLERAA
ncbi:MAG: hypothetical protein ABIT01_17655 [Thermoanaerobaculia bacterium]